MPVTPPITQRIERVGSSPSRSAYCAKSAMLPLAFVFLTLSAVA